MTRVHVIPIPAGWSVEQAWEHIQRGDAVPGDGGGWGVVVEDSYRGPTVADLERAVACV